MKIKYHTLLKAGIKNQKSNFIGILLLVFIITVSLLAVLSIWKNANVYEEEQIDRIGFGDVTWWLTGSFDEELVSQVIAIEGVDRAEMQMIGFSDSYYVGEDVSVSGTLMVLSEEDEQYEYHIYNQSLTGVEEEPAKLQKGEVYVSPAFCSLYGVQVGDTLEIAVTGREDAVSYKLKGYFEDPIAGSSMMGFKSVLMTEADMQELFVKWEAAGEETVGGKGSMFHVFKAADSSLPTAEFQSIVSEKTELKGAAGWTYSKTTIMGFMLILQDIFSGFLLVFVLVLLVVTMIIIGHSISSSIEQDYVDMGILKAVGFTRSDLRMVQLLQYMIAILGGMIPGVPVSILLVKMINRQTVTVTGLIVPADIPVGISLVALGMVLLLMIGFICMKTAGIGRITPIRAIRGGAEDVYFKSRFMAPVHKKGLHFWLAYRQLVSGKKQYISACLVAALLVFFISLTVRLDAWLGPDGKGLMDSFEAAPYDLAVKSADEDMAKEIEAFIASRAGITDQYKANITRGLLNQIEYMAYVIDKPEYYNMVEGRTCLYQNELVMTEFVAEELGVRIGDTVQLTWPGREEMEYIISGIYQCANDMGANFGVNREGYERLLEEQNTEPWYFNQYLLNDSSLVEELSDRLDEKYGEQISIDTKTWSGKDAILLVMSVLTAFMYAITIIFVLITVILTGSKILYKEQHDLGIYKSLGFVSGKLRLAFALRFAMVAAVGSVLGIVLSAYLTDPLVTAVLRICGVSRFTSSLGPFRMLLPAVVVCGMFLLFAYLTTGKIKKVEPGILIVE